MKNLFFTLPARVRPAVRSALALGVVLISGCDSGEKPLPPLTRADLSLRIIESSAEGDFQAALRQCEKLEEVGIHSAGFARVMENVRFNAVISRAQTALDGGDPAAAAAIMTGSRRFFAGNQRYLAEIDMLERLVQVEKTLKIIRDPAGDPALRRAAVRDMTALISKDRRLEIFSPEIAAADEKFKAEDAEAAEKAAAEEPVTALPEPDAL